MVPTIVDSTGRQVRQLDASMKAGLHRTPWDLRETAPAKPAAERGTAPTARPAAGGGEQEGARRGRSRRPGGGGRGLVRSGPPVKAGSYQVTLGRLVNGTVILVGKAVTVEVVSLRNKPEAAGCTDKYGYRRLRPGKKAL